ncbi:MAG TPA: hypothetical protein DEP69_04645, partial [Acidimicrobiaceae bacterium]|nr:hypothetical protein [Acidimicrobiaceae bacterium]
MALYLDDRELVIAHKSGDADAFTALVREYRPQLLSAARRRLHCHEAAEDAVQETLVRALRSLPRFNGQYLLGPWLHRILRNVCHDEGKRRGREGDKAERVAVSPDFDVLSNTGPEADLGLDLDHSALHDAFAELPANYQEALRLRFIEELPYPEVAEKSGVSEENARARVSRARAMLRKSLQGVAMLPVVGVVLPMLGKALAGTALLAAVLTPAGDSRQTVNPTPAQPELVRTAEVDVATPLPADLAV